MPCYFPIRAWRTTYINPDTEKRQITFNRKNGFEDMELALPCGKCEGCIKKRVEQWALRCVHESQHHEHSCFITLTYDDDNLPKNGSLDHSHFQKFMKRLRKKYTGVTIKYFMCGEYGGSTLRPHFHALLFGIDFFDKTEYSIQKNITNYTSATLSDLWTLGFHTIGDVHYGTAKYVAKYSLKRAGELGHDYDELGLKPEYLKMSQGLGAKHALKYKNEMIQNDNFIVNGYKNPVPRYYEKFISKTPLAKIKNKRVQKMKPQTLFELDVKRTINLKETSLWT